MTDLTIASAVQVELAAKSGDSSAMTVALFTCIGLLASLCVMTFGIDLSAGWGLM